VIILRGARERVDELQFSPDGRTLAAPCSAGVQLWHGPAAGAPTAVLPYQQVRSALFTPDGRKLLLLGQAPTYAHLWCPGRVLVHDRGTNRAAEVPLELTDQGALCSLSPDGRHLIVAQSDHERQPRGRIFCRPLDDLETSTWAIDVDRPSLAPPLYLAGGERFVSFEWWIRQNPYRAGPLYVTRDARNGRVLTEAAGPAWRHFTGFVLSTDRARFAARRRYFAAVFLAEDFAAEPVTLRNDSTREFTGLAFHPSGRFLAATSNDATVKFYDVATWTVTAAFDWQVGRLRSVAFSPDGMLAAAGGDNGQVVVWDVDL